MAILAWPLIEISHYFFSEWTEVRFIENNGSQKIEKEMKGFNREELRRQLEIQIAKNDEPPLSMRQVAKLLNHDLSHLINLFPKETQIISSRFKAYKAAKRIERKRKVDTEVHNGVYKVHAERMFPSQKRVQKYLSKPCYIREGEQAWKESLTELGYDANNLDQEFDDSTRNYQER